MRVNVIGKSNGVGLSRDLMLMADALRASGCDVVVTVVDARTSHRRRSRWVQWLVMSKLWWRKSGAVITVRQTDVNVMLEHVWPEAIPMAEINVVVPNPEWFDRHDMRMLRFVDRVWAKTNNTKRIFDGLSKLTIFIGFDSGDRISQLTAKKREYFHLAGKSTMKGTGCLVKLWKKHPEWPRLVIVRHQATPEAADDKASNIGFLTGYIDDIELLRMQNSYAFHLCTSETEGWGHYLAEAMSVGAVTITLDAPPMNELVNSGRGVLLPAHALRRQKLAQCYTFDENALSKAIKAVDEMSDAEIEQRGAAARSWFLQNKVEFNQRIARAVSELRV